MKTRNRDAIEGGSRVTVDINELQKLLGLGRNSAARIGKQAHALIKIGRRNVYSVQKVSDYMDMLSSENADEESTEQQR